MVSVVDITQRFRMVSVVGFLLWFPSRQETFSYGFRRWLFYGFRRGRKRFLMVSVAERFLWFPSRQVTFFFVSRQVTCFIAASDMFYRGK